MLSGAVKGRPRSGESAGKVDYETFLGALRDSDKDVYRRMYRDYLAGPFGSPDEFIDWLLEGN